ncbi:GNAT family N-acetyltransferase [Luethyella okanaganae]|uniref:GNAT family N-acetyltransferase n=1 Tax=Luethyella okanaganae TaxID=69372 RepID=A0ABW1VGU8_9MICO
MVVPGEVTIVSATDAPWADVEQVFGTRGDPSRCWCQFFKMSNAGWDTAKSAECKAEFQAQVRASATSPGVIAYLDGEAVGWCAVEPRVNYSRLARTKIVTDGSTEPLDDASVWAVTCFVVRVGYRRRGIAAALLLGAIEQARRHGARVLEGYPVDVAERAKTSAAELYHGSLSLFLGAGFEVASRPSPGRPVTRLQLAT